MSKVIVYTCAYNAERTISRTIDSVLNQTFDDFAYYIVDNGSTDATADIIDAYCSADERLYKLSIFENDLRYYGVLFGLLRRASMGSAQWATIIDADDTWTEDYLENMVTFAEENNLPLVMCGYDQIDDNTGELLKHKALESNSIVKRNEYVEQFVNYRGFTLAMWGKLFSLDCLSKNIIYFHDNHFMYGDSYCILDKWINGIDEFGVCGKSMYRYYIHKSAYTANNIEEVVEHFDDLYYIAKDFLEGLGDISNYNQNFLYAIYLTAVQDTVNLVVTSSFSQPRKLAYIKSILQKPILREVFQYKYVNHEINNMVKRAEILDGVIETIKSLGIKNEYKILYNDICATHDSLIELLY